jgi:hypothetical protein
MLIDSNAIFGEGKLILSPLVENDNSLPGLSGICTTLLVLDNDRLFVVGFSSSNGCVGFAVVGFSSVGSIGSGWTAHFFPHREISELIQRSKGLTERLQVIGS